jgi:hypothetical protein
VENDIFVQLVRVLTEKVEDSSDWLCSGNADNQESYAKVCGKIEAYKEIMYIVKDARSDFYSDDDEFDD